MDTSYAHKEAYVTLADANEKLNAMADYLRRNRKWRVLAFIDPYDMSVLWSSLEALKGLGIDLWILVPTGVGANRVLVNDGNIPEAWLQKLEAFLGIDRKEIIRQFYRQVKLATLFGEKNNLLLKERDTVEKLGRLYAQRLKEVFKYVSESFVMRNSTNSIMYHFMMATNNATALKIANNVIKPKYQL